MVFIGPSKGTMLGHWQSAIHLPVSKLCSSALKDGQRAGGEGQAPCP